MTYKDKFPSFDGTNDWYCCKEDYSKHEKSCSNYQKELDVASTFEKERDDIMTHVEEAISNILLSEGRITKHKPYTWLDEHEDEHLRKASRHILTYQIIRDNHQEPDDENHLDNAITRLAMGIARRKIKERINRNSSPPGTI